MPEYSEGPEAKDTFEYDYANALSGSLADKSEAEAEEGNRFYFTQAQTPRQCR